MYKVNLPFYLFLDFILVHLLFYSTRRCHVLHTEFAVANKNAELFDVFVGTRLVLINAAQRQLEVEPCVKDQGENSLTPLLLLRDGLQPHRAPLQTGLNCCLLCSVVL